jgi:hypothetical protein
MEAERLMELTGRGSQSGLRRRPHPTESAFTDLARYAGEVLSFPMGTRRVLTSRPNQGEL